MLVLPLADTSADLGTVGGKGASLARLAGAGLPVPPGFHVTTKAYREFLAAGEMPASVAAAIAEAYSGVVEGVARVITDVRHPVSNPQTSRVPHSDTANPSVGHPNSATAVCSRPCVPQ
jgi:pyruvate,water dikinase